MVDDDSLRPEGVSKIALAFLFVGIVETSVPALASPPRFPTPRHVSCAPGSVFSKHRRPTQLDDDSDFEFALLERKTCRVPRSEDLEIWCLGGGGDQLRRERQDILILEPGADSRGVLVGGGGA